MLLQKAINYTMYFLIAAVLIRRAPYIYENFRSEGKNVEIQKIYLSDKNQILSPLIFPATQKKAIAIFWASWCGPCKIELKRINKSINENEIKKENIYAISIDNELNALNILLKEKNYLFNVYFDKEKLLTTNLNITNTPTVLFIDGLGKIVWRTSGFSPTLISKIKEFQK
jgi:thiol-disulfide isomerase/thioredoxin